MSRNVIGQLVLPIRSSRRLPDAEDRLPAGVILWLGVYDVSKITIIVIDAISR